MMRANLELGPADSTTLSHHLTISYLLSSPWGRNTYHTRVHKNLVVNIPQTPLVASQID